MDEVLHSTEMEWQDWTRANPTLQHHFTSGPRNPMDEAQRNETFAIWDAQAEEVNHYLRPLSVHCDDTMLPIITKGILLRALAHSQELAQAIPPLCDPASLPAWESLHPEAADALNQLGDPNEVDPDMNDEDYDQGKIQQAISTLQQWRSQRATSSTQPSDDSISMAAHPSDSMF